MAPDEQRYTDEGSCTVEVDLFLPKVSLDYVKFQAYGQKLHA